MTDDELIAETKSLNSLIYELECYGVSDVMRLESALSELERRGYIVNEKTELVFEKQEEEGEGVCIFNHDHAKGGCEYHN